MIVYDKLANMLNERNMTWKDLCNAGVSVNIPAKFSHNKVVTTDTLDKVCEYLKVQPSDIMEWISEDDYEKRLNDKKNSERLAIETQIAELQKKLKNL